MIFFHLNLILKIIKKIEKIGIERKVPSFSSKNFIFWNTKNKKRKEKIQINK